MLTYQNIALSRSLVREQKKREIAEIILEEKSTEIYNLSEQLNASKRELQDISARINYDINTLLDAYIVVELTGDVIKMNHSAKVLLGYDSEEEPFNLLQLLKAKDIEFALEAFRELVIHGAFKNFRSTILTKDNQEKIVQVNANIIYDKEGVAMAAQGIVRDISDEIYINEKLKESEDRLSAIITNLDTGILLEDENRKVILTNINFCKIFSIAAAPLDLKGMDCVNLAEESRFYFAEPENFLKRVNKILQHKKQVLGDELVLKDGRILERNYIPVYSKGVYKGHLWSYLDITHKKKYSESLKAEKEKYSNIINNMNLGLIELDTEGYIKFANNSFCKLSGYTRQSLNKIKAEEFLYLKKDRNMGQQLWSKRKRGVSDSYEVQVKTKNGQLKNWLVSGAPNYDLNGKLIGSIGIHLDITEQKNINRRLNDFAQIVSHDLKAPLSGISALISWTKEDLRGHIPKKSLASLDLIQQRVEKMDYFIDDILQYSSIGKTELRKQKVDLNQVLKNVIEILYVPAHFNIVTLKSLPTVLGDSTQLQQVFLNLLSNAIKYNDKEKGEIEIDFIANGSFLTFSIKDNGIGIELEDQRKIFKVFRSLGNNINSTGIGLNIVKRIIGLYRGKVWVDSKIGIGSTFYFTLNKSFICK